MTAALHALILFIFYLLISGLGYTGLVVFQQQNIFLIKNKQQEPCNSSKRQERHNKNTVLKSLSNFLLRAMVDVEPYGSSDLGGDPSYDEPPSLTSASPSEDDDPEDPENPSGRKKKKKRKTRRPEGRRSQEAKAIATSKIVVNLPEFTGKDLSEFAENLGRFLRMTGQTHASGRVKCDLLLQCCKTKYLEKQVKQILTKSATFADVLVAFERQYPIYETDLSIRAEIQNLAVLPHNPNLPGSLSYWLTWITRLDD